VAPTFEDRFDSQASQSQLPLSIDSKDFFELCQHLRRALLSPNVQIRIRLYEGLNKLIDQNTLFIYAVLDMIYPQVLYIVFLVSLFLDS
jgi:hypothetical protein